MKTSAIYLCAGFLAFFGAVGCRKQKPPPPPPPTVQVVTVAPTNVPIFEEWIGTLDGYVNAQIRAQVSGYLLTQDYTEGSDVKKGDLLFQIDPRPYQAALDQANAKLAQDQSQLERTRLDVERFTPLAKDRAVSQQELDNAINAYAAAQAQVKADQAAIENASLNVSFTRITSPIDGLAGVALVQIGDLVGPAGGILTTISTIDPIKVYFQVSEQSYFEYWRKLADAEGNSNAENQGLQLNLSHGSPYSDPGKFLFVDRQVNINTGTLQITAVFPNHNRWLRPGQYGRVRAQTETKTNALLVPQRAVTELQGSYQVAVVGESNKVKIVSVKAGERFGTDWIIDQGLKPGDRVVVEGTQKAKPGLTVDPQPFPQPPRSEAMNR